MPAYMQHTQVAAHASSVGSQCWVGLQWFCWVTVFFVRFHHFSGVKVWGDSICGTSTSGRAAAQQVAAIAAADQLRQQAYVQRLKPSVAAGAATAAVTAAMARWALHSVTATACMPVTSNMCNDDE